MKKSLVFSAMICSFFFLGERTSVLSAQKITVPFYAYGAVYAQYGTVTQDGVANPGPYGGYLNKEVFRASDISFAHGYRWWSYPGFPWTICGPLPLFDFPGNHGVWSNSSIACGNPPTGYMGSWGGVIIDPELKKIWCLAGSRKYGAPTTKYCIPNPYGSGQLCYNLPSTWGRGDAYGYMRKVVVIRSTGTLNTGDPVQIRAKLEMKGTTQGEGTVTSSGVLMLNREGYHMEYMRWSDIMDFWLAPMLAKFMVDLNKKDSATVALAVGDTIILETAFLNRIQHDISSSPFEAVGWAGKEPNILMTNLQYVRTDSVKKIIRQYGNSLEYDLECLTSGAVLENVSASGPNSDEDKDGISDFEEKGEDGDESSFDGNSDGIADYKQAGVASFHTYDWNNYVTMTVPAGTQLSEVNVTNNPSPTDKPADAEFPWGFFDFSIDGLDPGEAIAVTLILHDSEPAGKYYKYGITSDNLTSHWYEFMYNGQTGAEIDGKTVILHFVDGLRGDEDITANGSIKEPGGPTKSGATIVSELKDEAGFSVYPNPADDYLTFTITDKNENVTACYEILDLHGRTLIDGRFEKSCSINTQFLSSGLYIISIEINKKIYKRPVIIDR